MTDMTLPWPARGVPGRARDGVTGPVAGDDPEGVTGDDGEGVTGTGSQGVIDPDGEGVTGGWPEDVTDGERITPTGDWAVTDTTGRTPRRLPATVTATLSWMGSAAGSDIIGGGPGGLIDRIRHPEPTQLAGHYSAIVNHPRKPGNEYLAVLFTGTQLIATLPVKITGKTLQGIGAAGKRIDLAGNHPATIAVIAATAAAMILAIIYT